MKTTSGRGLYGTSLVLGALALAELLFLFLPKVRPLGHILDLIQLYLERLNPALKGIIGNGLFAQTGVAIVLAWLASYVAIEAFSRQKDGLSLWHNISYDSCGKIQHGLRRKLCTAPKWLATLVGAPLLILWALLEHMRYGNRIVTVGFVTFDPTIVVMFIRHLLLGLALVTAIGLLMLGSTNT